MFWVVGSSSMLFRAVVFGLQNMVWEDLNSWQLQKTPSPGSVLCDTLEQSAHAFAAVGADGLWVRSIIFFHLILLLWVGKLRRHVLKSSIFVIIVTWDATECSHY